MMHPASRSLRMLAALLAFPIAALAQSAPSIVPAAKASATVRPVAAPAAKSSSNRPATMSAAATPATNATVAAVAPSAAAVAGRKAAPARDANGRFIARSTLPAAPPAAVSATCRDGSTWTGKRRSGACSDHGGVKSFN